ncbi:hypothetical protein PoB_001075000 [Plakobranchus ocellatus]|uniref:Uncharacterized protein n=1 Tax=Plakobranchus ocellatus TaxID=259542 RepID=A0AAV3YMB4_9GAST|nr:hypothetical protein PoB_001075000 [Plakobranchus ocellatus]
MSTRLKEIRFFCNLNGNVIIHPSINESMEQNLSYEFSSEANPSAQYIGIAGEKSPAFPKGMVDLICFSNASLVVIRLTYTCGLGSGTFATGAPAGLESPFKYISC